ncbi:MAG: GntP family permease, partial [Verrucomicrobiota bacterium]
MAPVLLFLVGIAIVLGGVLWLKLHPFLALIFGALAVAFLTPDSAVEAFAQSQVSKGDWTEKAADKFTKGPDSSRVVNAFGGTCAKVGVVIAMASVIGSCLFQSGAAQQLVDTFIRVAGVARAQLGFLVSGFCLAIPVFFDTVFYLLVP